MNDDSHKFGTIKGVLIPNITMMIGVILFLRLGVLTAHAQPIQMLGAIGLSLVIMILTSLSIGALATNMQVGSGGVYYIISRTLGIEVGGAVGIAIYFAQLISITLTVAGFAVSICSLYPNLSLPVVEVITLAALCLLAGFSASWALRLQGVIVVVLAVGVASILTGSASNLGPAPDVVVPFYPGGSLSFWQTFAMFYPAMTGIEAGMALSGSLKNPGRSLFYGNLISLVIVAIAYASLSLFAYTQIPHNILISDPFAFVEISSVPKLVHLGIWCATLSSALGCLLGAPRMLQSMAEDGILHERLAVVYGRSDEPRQAMVLTSVLVAILLLATTIDQIIPMLAMICLVSYGLLNLVTMMAELMNTPAWRPQARIGWRYSALAVALIVIAMLMTAPGWAIFTFLSLVAGYLLLRRQELEAGFQDLRESLIIFASRLMLYRLGEAPPHALTWHPQILSILYTPTQDRNIHLAHSLTRRSGILSFVSIVPEEWQSSDRLQSAREALSSYLDKQAINCLSDVYPAESTLRGTIELLKAYGIGAIQPNTVMLQIDESSLNEELVEIVATCAWMKKNLMLLCHADRGKDADFTSRRHSRKKQIDIWWDPDDTSNFDLTLSLVNTLTDGFIFRGARVCMKAIVADENAEKPVYDYLTAHSKTSRYQASVSVSAQPLNVQAGTLSFVGLPPLEEQASEQARSEYLRLLKDRFKECEGMQTTILMTCYDQIEHKAIYHTNDPHSDPAIG